MYEPATDQLLDYRAQLMARLERQPAEMAAALSAIPETEWHRRPAGAARSVHMLAAHVRDMERLAFLPRVLQILDDDGPALRSPESNDWTKGHYEPGEPFTDILAAWAQARAEVLDRLPGPAGPDWTRVRFHPLSGKRTLQWWAERIYTHAARHIIEFRGRGRPRAQDT